MRKVFDRQLTLGSHPAAQAILPRPVKVARALIKGWLFYPAGTWQTMQGISAQHCRGFWCSLSELSMLDADRFVILPRLQWLPPCRAASAESVLTRAGLAAELSAHFMASSAPVLVSVMREDPGGIVEAERGFIVPDDWRERASQKVL
jgi:hypothetical protein